MIRTRELHALQALVDVTNEARIAYYGLLNLFLLDKQEDEKDVAIKRQLRQMMWAAEDKMLEVFNEYPKEEISLELVSETGDAEIFGVNIETTIDLYKIVEYETF